MDVESWEDCEEVGMALDGGGVATVNMAVVTDS